MIQIALESPIRTRPRRAEEYVANVVVRLGSALPGQDEPSAGYLNVVYDAARAALEDVDEPSRGVPPSVQSGHGAPESYVPNAEVRDGRDTPREGQDAGGGVARL